MSPTTLKKLLLYLAVGFVLLSLWNNPAGSAQSAVDVVGSIGSFFAAVIDKVATFVRTLTS